MWCAAFFTRALNNKSTTLYWLSRKPILLQICSRPRSWVNAGEIAWRSHGKITAKCRLAMSTEEIKKRSRQHPEISQNLRERCKGAIIIYYTFLYITLAMESFGASLMGTNRRHCAAIIGKAGHNEISNWWCPTLTWCWWIGCCLTFPISSSRPLYTANGLEWKGRYAISINMAIFTAKKSHWRRFFVKKFNSEHLILKGFVASVALMSIVPPSFNGKVSLWSFFLQQFNWSHLKLFYTQVFSHLQLHTIPF